MFAPATPREISSRDEILARLETLAHPFDEQADLVHLTGSAIVIGRRGTILHVHRRLGRWMQPGGHIDPGEHPWDTAVRETREETGLTALHPPAGPQLVHLDVHDAARGHRHLDLRYLLHARDEEPDPPCGESQQVRWFGWDEALALADDALVDGLLRARALAGG